MVSVLAVWFGVKFRRNVRTVDVFCHTVSCFNIDPKSPDQVNTSLIDIQNIYMYMINKLYVRIKLYFSNHSMYVIVYINYLGLLFERRKFGATAGE